MIKRLFKTAGMLAILGVSLISTPVYATSSFQLFGQEVVLSASQHIGLPYVWGGEDPNRGFDCSGLIKYTFEEFNITLPHRADLQFNYGEPVKKDALQPGDVVFFATGGYPIGHVGIYVGERRFIHAPRRGRPVSVDSIDGGYYSARFVGARRIKPDFF